MANSFFVLGPSLDNVIEPEPITQAAMVVAGQRSIAFADPATSPGGNVNLVLLNPATPTDVTPVNVYAFFVQPVSGVPSGVDRTPDWFFKSGAPSGSVSGQAADPFSGRFTITVGGVKPSLDPYFVQTILEFPGA